MNDSIDLPTLERGPLRLGPPKLGEWAHHDGLVLEDTHLGLGVPLTAEDLRWLVVAAGPAVLAAVPRPPLLPPRAAAGGPQPIEKETHAA